MRRHLFLFTILFITTSVNAGLGLKRHGWRLGQTINIQVIDGDPFQLACLRLAANEVAEMFNIRLAFKPTSEWPRRLRPDARMYIKAWESNNATAGNSNVGNRKFYTEYMMLRLGTYYSEIRSLDDCRERRAIRHEIGHLLGLEHEHQHPDVPSPVTAAILVRDAGIAPMFIEPFPQSVIAGKRVAPYDPNSIMHYEVELPWAKFQDALSEGKLAAEDFRGTSMLPEGSSVRFGATIGFSDGDRAMLREMYPPRQ